MSDVNDNSAVDDVPFYNYEPYPITDVIIIVLCVLKLYGHFYV